MISKKSFSRSTILLLITLLNACAVIAPPNTPTPTTTSTPTSTSTATPTAAPTPKPTTMPTGDPQDETWVKLKSEGYEVTINTSTNLNGNIYYAYLLKHLTHINSYIDFEYCTITFYQWNGYQYNLIKIFDNQNYRWNRCTPINWDQKGFPLGESVTPAMRNALSLSSYWSDINRNGYPEFTITYDGGCANVTGYACFYINYYEIRNEKLVIDLSEKVAGKIIPDHIFYEKDPMVIYILSQTTYSRIHRWEFEIYWLYKWDGQAFVNVSSAYPDEYRGEIKKRVERLEKSYGAPLPYPPFWGPANWMTDILEIYNQANLPQEEGLKIFLEVTKPSHWLNSKKDGLCWLQASRAYAQIDFEKNKPFRIFIMLPRAMDGKYDFPTDIDSRFDTSACK